MIDFISMRWFFEHTKHMFQMRGKKIILILRHIFPLSALMINAEIFVGSHWMHWKHPNCCFSDERGNLLQELHAWIEYTIQSCIEEGPRRWNHVFSLTGHRFLRLCGIILLRRLPHWGRRNGICWCIQVSIISHSGQVRVFAYLLLII